MIISASRRTDIPAFYFDWFLSGLKRGFVYSRNPFNAGQVRKISLRQDDVDCFVFWTRNPSNITRNIGYLEGYPNYTMVTITGYSGRYERYLPSVSETITSFIRLSKLTDKRRTIWRYDPIMYTNEMDTDWHISNFRNISKQLEGFTERCIISFVDTYKSKRGRMESLGMREPDKTEATELAAALSEIACDFGIMIQTCCEYLDPEVCGITKGACIDGELINSLKGYNVDMKKDRNQRKGCNCVKSIDIGEYYTCLHDCAYCYANGRYETSVNNFNRHNPDSPYLIERQTDENI